MTYNKTIYKKDTKGKIRFLQIIAEDGYLYQKSGVLDTENIVKHSKLCKSKNIGKSNETTPEEQAILEAEAKVKDKLTKGYFETVEDAETEEVILPMLAKDYKKESGKIDWSKDVYIQPKLDGMRCLAIIKNGNVTFKSRDGKNIENIDHIKNELTGLEDQILDGELYAHGLSFQENMKLIKKYRPGKTEDIKYHVYDFVDNLSFKLRFEKLKTLIDSNNFKTVELVFTKLLDDKLKLPVIHMCNMNDSYEGSIIRHGDNHYKINGRCSSLLKYKDFKDISLEIEQITPNEVNPLHGTPHFNLKGKSFKAGCKLSHKERENLLLNKHKYIGKIAEIRYFEETDDGIPRFPVMVGIRLDK